MQYPIYCLSRQGKDSVNQPLYALGRAEHAQPPSLFCQLATPGVTSVIRGSVVHVSVCQWWWLVVVVVVVVLVVVVVCVCSLMFV